MGVLLAVLLLVLVPVRLPVLGGPPGGNGSAPPPGVPDDLDELEVEFPGGRDDGLLDVAELEEALLEVGILVGKDPDAGIVEFPRVRDDGLLDVAELEEALLEVGILVGRDPDTGIVEFPRVRDADLVGTGEVLREPVPKGTGILLGPFVLVDLVPDDVELDRRLLDDIPLDLDIVELPVLVLKVGFLEKTVEFLLGENVFGLAGVELVLACVG
ncbi:hypothetical protein HYFRA_00007680 [Hymenoscyphus fraxineus]|uniref:Uncharacterized protein n=1 Tax=Hymenoscyphus fraxineus TaxID=746836 RepID=A0A9N9KS96_9HELO|nr:hypothetical protein HYFRA_00007680 [Hymenoscyphus fraxineus]